MQLMEYLCTTGKLSRTQEYRVFPRTGVVKIRDHSAGLRGTHLLVFWGTHDDLSSFEF